MVIFFKDGSPDWASSKTILYSVLLHMYIWIGHVTLSLSLSLSLLSSFIPMWKLVKDTSEQLSSIHAKFFKMLSELSREITEYNIAQKEKQKTVVR